MDVTERPFKSLDLIFELAREKLESQSDHWRAIDQKNSIVLAVYGILLVLAASFDTDKVFVISKYWMNIILSVWLVIIVIGMGCSIKSIMPRLMGASANVVELSKRFLKADPYDTRNHLLSSFEATITENEKIIARKRKFLSFSIKFFLPLSFLLGVMSIFIQIIQWKV